MRAYAAGLPTSVDPRDAACRPGATGGECSRVPIRRRRVRSRASRRGESRTENRRVVQSLTKQELVSTHPKTSLKTTRRRDLSTTCCGAAPFVSGSDRHEFLTKADGSATSRFSSCNPCPTELVRTAPPCQCDPRGVVGTKFPVGSSTTALWSDTGPRSTDDSSAPPVRLSLTRMWSMRCFRPLKIYEYGAPAPESFAGGARSE